MEDKMYRLKTNLTGLEMNYYREIQGNKNL